MKNNIKKLSNNINKKNNDNINKYHIEQVFKDFFENNFFEDELLELDKEYELSIGDNLHIVIGMSDEDMGEDGNYDYNNEDLSNYYIEITNEIRFGELEQFVKKFVNKEYGEDVNYEIKGGLSGEDKRDVNLLYYGNGFRYKGDEEKVDFIDL